MQIIINSCIHNIFMINKNELENYLFEWDKFLNSKINIIAVGGTALNLLNKKESTKDVDFCFLNELDKKRFIEMLRRIGYSKENPLKFKNQNLILDLYSQGYIFCVQLEEDYFKKAIKIKEFHNIHLFSLNPLDLIITKTARLNSRDIEDIKIIFKNYEIDINELTDRYKKTMENSMVADYKLNFISLLNILKNDGFIIPKSLINKVDEWEDGL